MRSPALRRGLAGERRLAQALDQLPQLRAALDADLARQNVAADGQLRPALLAEDQRLGHHLARQVQVRLDRRLRVSPPGGQAVRAGQERRLDLDGLRGGQVAVDRGARQRALVHQEAEPQVVAGDPAQVLAQRRARLEPAADRRDNLLADRVVADERHPPVGQLVARRGLADVVEERGKAQGLAAGQLVAQVLVEHGTQAGSRLAEHALQVLLEPDQLLEHLERVAVDVGVVELVLGDTVEVGPLRDDRGDHAQVVTQVEAVEHAIGQHQAAQLGPDALGGGLGDAGRRLASGLGRRRVRRQVELGRQPDEPQGPEWVALVGARQHAQQPAVHVAQAAARVDRIATVQRHRDRVDRKVALGQVGLDSRPLERRQVGHPGAVRGQRPVGAERVAQTEDRAAGGPPDRLGRRMRVTVDGQVDVHDRPAEQRVANGPAHDPGAGVGQRVAHRPDRGRILERPQRCSCRRRTRGVSPQVTS